MNIIEPQKSTCVIGVKQWELERESLEKQGFKLVGFYVAGKPLRGWAELECPKRVA